MLVSLKEMKTVSEELMNKTIITVVGKDTVGIIAKVCTYLADSGINILDISQTIVSGYFNMMMIVDMAGTAKDFNQVADDLDKLGTEIGVVIKCQREEIFDSMHRI
jgi:ACT domain-containing protein